MSRRFGPLRPGATIAAAIMFLILIGLGVWQLERLQWKSALLAERQSRAAAEAIALPPSDADLADLNYRHAMATGVFDHSRELLLGARSLRGNPGVQVITPLLLEDGRVLLVNRGWVPDDRRDPAMRAAGQIDGRVTIEGLLRIPRPQHWLEPDNQVGEATWYWVELPAMAAALDIPPETLTPFWLEAGSAENSGGFPIGGQSRIDLPNDHLQYALTWFCLALGLVGIWFFFHWRPIEEKAGAETSGEGGAVP